MNKTTKNIKEKIVLIGGGGHCKVVINTLLTLEKYQIIGFVDNKNETKDVLGIKHIGCDDDLIDIFAKGCRNAFIAVGSVGDCRVRVKLADLANKIGFRLPTLIHPSAIIAKDVRIGEGTFIAAGTVINPGAVVGSNVIINTRASIDHDCRIGDFVHLAPGATLSGGVEIGAKTHIGTGSAIIEYLKIGTETIIGAGSVVISNIPQRSMAFGNPCKVKGKNQ